MKKALRYAVIILALPLLALVIWHFGFHRDHHANHNQHPALVPTEGFGSVGAFTLINQDGVPFGSKELDGNIWVGNFIFTRCAGPCPIISGKMAGLQKEFGQHANLKFISFSVDPNYDKPPVLSQYAKTYGAKKGTWYFLTGSRPEVYDLIREKFRLAVQESEMMEMPENNDHILHSLHFVLVGKKGDIQGYYNSNDPEAVSDLKVKLNYLLKRN